MTPASRGYATRGQSRGHLYVKLNVSLEGTLLIALGDLRSVSNAKLFA